MAEKEHIKRLIKKTYLKDILYFIFRVFFKGGLERALKGIEDAAS